MKSQAVLSDGWGMPGVSGELKESGEPTRPGRAKLPGVVPVPAPEGSPPRAGSSYPGFAAVPENRSGGFDIGPSPPGAAAAPRGMRAAASRDSLERRWGQIGRAH